jgi:hypothetical protein
MHVCPKIYVLKLKASWYPDFKEATGLKIAGHFWNSAEADQLVYQVLLQTFQQLAT